MQKMIGNETEKETSKAFMSLWTLVEHLDRDHRCMMCPFSFWIFERFLFLDGPIFM